MKKVYVLGDGQLGHMLRQAGEPLGIMVQLIGINTKLEVVSFQQNVTTVEIERWPQTTLTNKLVRHPSFINRDVFPIITDRLMQKQFLEKLNFITTPWQLLTNKDEWPSIFNRFGEIIVVKLRINSYDGRGQWLINKGEINTISEEYYNKCIIEQKIDFSDEVSLIGARSYNGDVVFYPLTYNLHQRGILYASVVFPVFNSKYQKEAEMILSTIMHVLNYVGVMVIEFFIVSGRLIINELAPRVHNSGHWTQNGASISQFELHLRAIVGLPLSQPVVVDPSVMINLIGIDLNYNWLKLPSVHLHWYNKTVRAGRKVGHLNLNCINSFNKTLKDITPLMTLEYSNIINWVKMKLTDYTTY